VGTDWHEISELELHAKLYKYVRQTTPLIKQMLTGEEITVNGDEFKLLREGK
jgi:hypothetical protein